MTTDTAGAAEASPHAPRKLPPVLGRLMTGTLWLALRIPLQIVFSLWTIPLIFRAIGQDAGAYGFAWGFGFFQMLFEFGMSSALQRQVTDRWTRGDRDGVDRAIACGMNFYTVMALVQMVALLGVTYVALPFSRFEAGTTAYSLIVKLLWLQIATAPFFGLSAVLSSVLQAARRYEFMPRLELLVVTLRFLILWAGVTSGVDFFLIVVTQTIAQIALVIAPSLWVMVRELGHTPHFSGARWDDYRALWNISLYMFLIQLSVVLADRLDTTILGYAADDPAWANKIYMAVSKPFLMIRQTGWTLAYMVMPAVASLIAARDERSLERITYDATRLHVAALLPVSLLAFVYAPPFLTLWVGDTLGCDPKSVAPLLRLFLVATIPLVLSVPVQAAFGMGKVKAVALSALGGAVVNLPLSYILVRRMGVSGVIWGTVLTTLFSNLLIPGVYVFRVLGVRPRTFLVRTLSAPAAGAAAMLVAAVVVSLAFPLVVTSQRGLSPIRFLPLAAHLAWCCLAYVAGYLATPIGRGDLVEIAGKLRSRLSPPRA